MRAQALPVGHAARALHAHCQQVPRKIQQLPGAKLPAQKEDAGLVELVGFIEHHHAHRRQQFGDPGFPQGNICEEKGGG